MHLNTINQFQIRFKTQKTHAETICHLFSRRRHSHNRRVQNVSFIKPECFCGTELIVYHLTQTTVHFESLTIVFDDVIVFSPLSTMPPRYLIVESRANIRSEMLTQWTAGCKTLNNDHCDYTYYQGLLLVFFSFMVDYIKFRLALAIFFQGNFHMWCEETFICTKFQ